MVDPLTETEGGERDTAPMMGLAEHPMTTDWLLPGTEVEVRRRFDAAWARGFEVASADEDGYRLRRLSDGEELPTVFVADDVRAARNRNDMWWY